MPEPTNNNTSQRTSSTVSGKNEFKPGPFVAIVRNHLDTTYMGGLEVELLSASGSGNSTNAPGQLLTVKYLSPFYGVTSYDGTNKNSGHSNSQRSYGWWGIPPDIGAKVLVIFAEGGDGFWIGCIPEENTNIMVPDPYVSSTYNDKDKSKKLPVVEYNKKVEKGTGRDSTQFIKPVNTDILNVLTTQGLITDEIRGVTSSSSRRELPSSVMGFSSPGPYDKRPGAPRVNYGENFSQTTVPQNRLGGSSLVFDDGDATLLRKTPASSGPPVYVNAEAGEKGGNPALPHNELVRLRTRTGHQILLHNTEDLIYIGNAKGTTWIELTSNGKLDIYAADSVSIHSQADINLKADKSIYMEAGENIHMKAGTSIFGTAASNIELKAGADGRITAANTHIKAGTTFIDQNLKVNGALNVTGNIGTPSTVNAGTLSAPTTNTTVSAGGSAGASGEAATAAGDAQPSQRVPEHEPWAGHENLNGIAATTPDTFRKSVKRTVGSTPAAGASAEGNAGEEAAAQNAIVKQPPAKPAMPGLPSIPANVADAANAVKANMNSGAVASLTNSISGLGNKLTFGVSQAITATIDGIASSSVLKSIQSVTGPAIESLTAGASDLLNLRTTVAKGQVPETVPVSTAPAINSTEADREKIVAIAAKPVSGTGITLSDGKQYRTVVTKGVDEDGFSYTQTKLEEIPVDAT
tara:strand:- start:39848 stop:41923 length:2076 start_codon:yes stop_codon:yes gene_type:complete